MGSWLLIMTFVAGPYSSVSVTTAPFANEAACMTAANAWLVQARELPWPYARALCVRTS